MKDSGDPRPHCSTCCGEGLVYMEKDKEPWVRCYCTSPISNLQMKIWTEAAPAAATANR